MDGIWEELTIVPVQQAVAEAAETNERVEMGEDIFAAQNMAKDIACVPQEGFKVDNDNEPLPENVPADGNMPPTNEGLYKGQSWGWDGVDRRITTGGGIKMVIISKSMDPTRQVILGPVPVFFSNGLVIDHPACKDGRGSVDIGEQPGPCHFW